MNKIHKAKIEVNGRTSACFVLTHEGVPLAAINEGGVSVLSGGPDVVTYSPEPEKADRLAGRSADELAAFYKAVPPLVQWGVG